MNVSFKVLHYSLLLAMTLPAISQASAESTAPVINLDSDTAILAQHATAGVDRQQTVLQLSEDKLQTRDRLDIQDKLKTMEDEPLQTRDRDSLKTRDLDRLQTQDPDTLQSQDRDKLQTRVQDGTGSGQQQQHQIRNMFQYEKRVSGQGLNSGGSMNRSMHSVGGGSAGGGSGRR